MLCSPSPQTQQKSHLRVERFIQNIYSTLAEELKPPKGARKPPHNWVKQKERQEPRWDQHSREGAVKEERNPHPGKPPNRWGDQLRRRDRKVGEKSTAAGRRRAEQSESHTDHLHHCPRHQSLRHLGGGRALRLRLWQSVPRRGLGLAVWRQPAGLGSSVPWVREWDTTAKGTWEEVWAHRRSKVPLLGRARGEGP